MTFRSLVRIAPFAAACAILGCNDPASSRLLAPSALAAKAPATGGAAGGGGGGGVKAPPVALNCPVTPGDTMVVGTVLYTLTEPNPFAPGTLIPENLVMEVGNQVYYVATNYAGLTAFPRTQPINLLCRLVPFAFIHASTLLTVTGTIDPTEAAPDFVLPAVAGQRVIVIHASWVQVPTFLDGQ